MESNHFQFIGRKQQNEQLKTYIEKKDTPYLQLIHGAGGVGKTWLLRDVESQYKDKAGFFCFPLVDFSQSQSRTQRWLMDFFTGLVPGEFKQYRQARTGSERKDESTGARIVYWENLRHSFLNDLEELPHEIRYIFIFDTLELIQDTLLLDFILEMAERVQNGIFILAGRRNLELGPELGEELVNTTVLSVIELGGFTLSDAIDYMEVYLEDKALTEDEKHALYLLTDNGIPIKLALAGDWLSRGLAPDVLIGDPAGVLKEKFEESNDEREYIINAFEKNLVSQISELGNEVDHAIRLMAHVHRRFNTELLQRLLPDVSTESLVAELKGLLFVKFIEDDYFVLHDEIQRMVEKHIWSSRDETHEKRREISRTVIAYYDEKLTRLLGNHNQPGELPEEVRREYRIYQVERLHYQLDVDLADGYRHFTRLFEEFEDRRNIELAVLALDVLAKGRPMPVHLRNFVETYYRGWTFVRRQNLNRAYSCISKGLEELNVDEIDEIADPTQQQFLTREVKDRLGEIYTLFGYCHRLMGVWDTALAHYQQAYEFNRRLIDAMHENKLSEAAVLKRAYSRLAETLNDIANLQRMLGRLDEARRYCKISLFMREGLNEEPQVGHCCYVMGMIMWEAGNTSESIRYLNRARDLYQKTGLTSLEHAWIDSYEGYVMFRTGNFGEAMRLLNRAIQETEDNPDLQEEHTSILLYMARIHREENPEQSYEEASSALDIAERIHSNFRAAEARLTLCLTLQSMVKAQKYPQRRAKLQAEFDNHFKQGLILAQQGKYRRLEGLFAEIEADLAFARKNYFDAFDKYTLACHRATQFKPAVFARALSILTRKLQELVNINPGQAINICALIKKRWQAYSPSAKKYPEFEQGIDFIAELAETFKQRNSLNRSLNSSYNRGDWQEALNLCDQIDQIPIITHRFRVKTLYQRADIEHSRNNLASARLYCERAIGIQTIYGAKADAIGDSYLLLSQIYWKQGNTAEAAAYMNRAEEKYREAESQVGVGEVELERAKMLFRTRQFKLAEQKLSEAKTIFEVYNKSVSEASALNLMSRMARVDPRYNNDKIFGFQMAQSYAEEALQILDEQDLFVATECYLTLCILHYVWGNYLISEEKDEEAQDHFSQAKTYYQQGSERLQKTNSPMLQSVYSGIRAQLDSILGDQTEAAQHYLDELIYATQTKHMRLLRALELVEAWLVEQEPEKTEYYSRWLIEQWQERNPSEKYPQVAESIEWLNQHRRYILQKEGSL